MKKANKNNLKVNCDYVCFCGYDWSPSGWDIANFNLGGELISQTNSENIFDVARIVYELPNQK